MKLKTLILVFLTTFTLFSCSQDDVAGEDERKIAEYIADKKLVVTETTESGLRYIRTKESPSGAALSVGQRVSVNYAGRLLNDKEFDSGTFAFVLGVGQVVPGFDIGISKMRVGEKATIIFPSAMGYGDVKQGSIPKNSPLVFDIEVLSAQ